MLPKLLTHLSTAFITNKLICKCTLDNSNSLIIWERYFAVIPFPFIRQTWINTYSRTFFPPKLWQMADSVWQMANACQIMAEFHNYGRQRNTGRWSLMFTVLVLDTFCYRVRMIPSYHFQFYLIDGQYLCNFFIIVATQSYYLIKLIYT